MKYLLTLTALAGLVVGSTGAFAATRHRVTNSEDAMAAAQDQSALQDQGASQEYRVPSQRRGREDYLPEVRSNDSAVINQDHNYGNPDRD